MNRISLHCTVAHLALSDFSLGSQIPRKTLFDLHFTFLVAAPPSACISLMEAVAGLAFLRRNLAHMPQVVTASLAPSQGLELMAALLCQVSSHCLEIGPVASASLQLPGSWAGVRVVAVMGMEKIVAGIRSHVCGCVGW